MILHLLWRPSQAADPAAEQQLQLARMLSYATRETRFYREYGSAKALSELPRIELLDYLRHPEGFDVKSAPPHPRQDLAYPVGRPPRTAVLGQEITGGIRVRRFHSYRSTRLAEFAPAALAAPSDTIRALAHSIKEGEIQWKPLRQALIVFNDVVRGSLTEEDRDYFWKVFQVPVFEQFRGFAGELLAQECEAHEGMHLQQQNVIVETEPDGQLLFSFLRNPRTPLFRMATNLTGRLAVGPCDCGATTPRLLDVRRRTATPASHRDLAVVNLEL